MKVVLWILQLALAVQFTLAGLAKLTTPYAELAAEQVYARPFAPWMIIAIGVAELLGAIGVILPALTRVLPVLTPIAATGLGLTMIGAAIVNVTQGAAGAVPLNAGLLVIAAIVAWGRFGRYAVPPRGTHQEV